jgi:hypothetical protein
MEIFESDPNLYDATGSETIQLIITGNVLYLLEPSVDGVYTVIVSSKSRDTTTVEIYPDSQ